MNRGTGWRGQRGNNWDKSNSIINEIHLKKIKTEKKNIKLFNQQNMKEGGHTVILTYQA